MFILAKRNYKVHAYLGLTSKRTTRFTVVLDTGAGSSFIRKDCLPPDVQKLIKPLHSAVKIKDANNRRVNLVGRINLVCQIGTRSEIVTFYVAERLATTVILGCDFCDRYIESIRPRRRLIQLDDGSTVPIVRKPDKRADNSVPLPEDQEFTPRKGRISPKVTVHKNVTIQPQRQTWVEVVTDVPGLISVEPIAKLLHNQLCAVGNGIAQVTPGIPFKVLMANFGKGPITFLKGQKVANAESHPTSVVETDLMLAEMLGIAVEHEGNDVSIDGSNTYRKRKITTKSVDTINQHLADLRESHMEQDEEPITADKIPLDEVPENLRCRVRQMLKKHEQMWLGKLGEINVTEHGINLKPDAKPFKSPPFRAGPKMRELIQFEVDKQLKAGVIEPATSEWAAPVLFAPKKDGRLRFCVDYRKLNEMTVRDSYPLPRMDECIDSLGEAKVFSTLDAYAGYWQMPVKAKDRAKTAFVCHAGTYQYRRMPFGLTNAPASFQRALDLILTKYKWKTCLIYLDDVIIYSKTVEEHIDHVDEVLRCLADAGVTLKIKKCKFFTSTVEYLGHIIKPGRLEIDQANTKSLVEALPPTNKSELRSFLGLANVYRRFVDKFAMVASPLNELLKKNNPDTFTLSEEHTESFRKLIDAITSPQVLALPQPGLPYSLDTDASAYGLGCALFQTHEDGERKPIGFWSRSLVPAEKNYSPTERECLGVVWALKTLRPYLMYEEFIVHTDHSSLQWLLTIQEPSGRLMRWRLVLAEFNFQIKYKLGRLNTQADALSRLQTRAETIRHDDDIPAFLMPDFTNDTCDSDNDECDSEDLLQLDYNPADELFATLPEPTPSDPLFTPITTEELLTEQLSDSFCTTIRRQLNEGGVVPFGFNDEGLLCRQVTDRDQIVVPHSLKARVLHINHYSRLAGHPGGTKLYHMIRKDMYWPALAVDCHATARRCPTCARNRIKLRRNTTQLKLFPATSPLEAVAIDILGELIKTARGNQYLLVISDRFTKLTKTVPLRTQSATEVAKAFVNEWVFNYGPPSDLLADNGKCFTSKFFQDVCRIINTHNSFTTTYHPQANGQVERFNRTIKAAIRSYLSDHPRDWDLYTGALTYAYNCQPHTSTALAPFELVLSRPPPPLALKHQPRQARGHAQEKQHWKQWLQKALTETRERLRKAQERYKKNYDERLRRQSETIKPEDFIYLRVERRDENETRHKLAAVAEGPFKVISSTRHTVVIERPDQTVERVSRDRVTLAPRPQKPEEIQQIVRPMTDQEIERYDYPVGEDTNDPDLPTDDTTNEPNETRKTSSGNTDGEPPNSLRESENKREEISDSTTNINRSTTNANEAEQRPETEEAHERATQPDTNPSKERPLRRSPRSRVSAQRFGFNTPSSGGQQNNSEATPPRGVKRHDQEYVMERIVSHGINEDPEHPTAKVGETTYQIRWYGVDKDGDTYEPIQHIPRNKVVSYYRRKQLPLPDNINSAQAG